MTGVDIYLPFFVYGTLLPGEANYAVWQEAIDGMRPAILSGARLYDLGYFPMAVEDAAGEVRGMVAYIRPSSYRAALSLLDELEGVDLGLSRGPVFRRARRVVRPVGGGGALVAWVYLGNRLYVAGLRPIGPDWKSYGRRGSGSM